MELTSAWLAAAEISILLFMAFLVMTTPVVMVTPDGDDIGLDAV